MYSKVHPRPSLRVGHLLAIAGMSMLLGCSSLRFVEIPVSPASQTFPTVAANCTCSVWPDRKQFFDRVIIVVFENTDYEQAMSNGYFHGLTRQGAYFLDFHGLFHPSYSNYLAMVSGRQVVTYYDKPRDVDECTVADTLRSRANALGEDLDWKNYAEGYPRGGQCYLDPSHGKYARKHVPFLSFGPVQRMQCGRITSEDVFTNDKNAGRLPSYTFYTPDLDHDGHDTGVDVAASWFQGFYEDLRKSSAWTSRTLLVVTFDESKDGSREYDNHIYTVFLGDMIRPGPVTGNYNHYNVLRTIDDNFGLCPLGPGDASAKVIDGVWKDR